jgi:hypothetical protein
MCGAAFVENLRQQNALRFLVITGHIRMSYFVVKPVANNTFKALTLATQRQLRT